jgi:transcription-repair coupling factor (superfamily II helicase)
MLLRLPVLSCLEKVRHAVSVPPHAAEVVGTWGAAKAVLAAQLAEALGRPLLYVTAHRAAAEEAYEDLATLCGESSVCHFPAWEVLPHEVMNPADDVVAERFHTLWRLIAPVSPDQTAQTPPVPQTVAPIPHVVLPVRALLQKLPSVEEMRGRYTYLRVGDEFPIDALAERLVEMGYEREVMVEARGTFSIRGGIVDVFPVSAELPYRLEFFGDEIESIRLFEPETQRSVRAESSIAILPRHEKQWLQDALRKNRKLGSILEYFSRAPIVVFDEPLDIAHEAQAPAFPEEAKPYLYRYDEICERIRSEARLYIAQLNTGQTDASTRVHVSTRGLPHFQGRLEEFFRAMQTWERERYHVTIVCVNAGERRRIEHMLAEQGYTGERGSFMPSLALGRIRDGFESSHDRFVLLSEKELFGRHFVRRARRRFEAGAAIRTFEDLRVGDYVVHDVHGIGRYGGLRRFEGKPGDYLVIYYAGGDAVYLPVTHIDHIQKYQAAEGALPKLDRLGGATWARTRQRVKAAVRQMAEELLRLYALRESSPGFAFSPDTVWQAEFEDSFPYEETPDQLRAIEEVKRDMESPKPMDRLICGDVGFGKTEVALRAAFKAVMDNKQVAVLCPTTLLAYQHYKTFSERLADFPITVEVLSRFRAPREVNNVLQRLAAGQIQIIIGTHRLLTKDIHFHDLGLLVIDEEQRFGVAQKERLKKLRASVDVLTLSATPIPRTLHFSLLGVRDMSLIQTAPNDRLPIHTCVTPWDDTVVREAIERELARNGQVYFLHNRVQTIEAIAHHVRGLVPRARVAYAHGQMPKHTLEEVMTAFVEGKIDVLVCTTIIASGIDIPNANTILVHNADNFGLSELYQIRGRVGRYKHRAFAYLLIPEDKPLTTEAQKRLKALEDFSALGSGFRVAMRDLEIRGAGDLLGPQQSGHIATVGYETYKELLAEAVAEVKGEPLPTQKLPDFHVAVDARIPDEYIQDLGQKMALYRRIASVRLEAALDDLLEEIKDRFGPVPGSVRRLIDVMRVRIRAAEIGMSEIAATDKGVVVSFTSAEMLTSRHQGLLRRAYGTSFSVEWGEPTRVALPVREGKSALEESLFVTRLLIQEEEEEAV